MNQEEQAKALSQLVAKCWADEAFKQKLLTDPVATLKAEGIELPAGLDVKVFENTDQVFHLVIPAKPNDLSDEDLDKVSGGYFCNQPFPPCFMFPPFIPSPTLPSPPWLRNPD